MKLTPRTTARVVRWTVLAASTVFFLFFSRFISVHAVCPIGGFELFFTGLFRTGFTVAGLFSGMVLLFLIMSVLSVFLRRAYCAYVCPIGALQEGFELLGARVLPKKLRSLTIPAKIDRSLRWLKYLVLASFVVGAATVGGHWMIGADPFIAFMSLNSVDAAVSGAARNPGSFIFLGAILVFAFFLGRGFCKYLCPAGAWYALLSKISPNRVVRDAGKCVGCGLCSKACPMGIDVAHSTEVKSAECLGCRECVNVCPKEGALTAPIGKLDLPAVWAPVASAAVFSGALFVAASAMPVGGGHRPTGTEPAGGGTENGVRQGGNPAYRKAKQVGSAGYGGCPSCVGCGVCTASATV